jgi:glucosamine--fructose-6-phosphate aminotransferase (isomerizing)
MCGIVGILGKEPVAIHIVEALRRLEYRGYDSAGVATIEHGAIGRRRAVGKLHNLAERLAREPLSGNAGIGHTRWATHGGVTETNAHPHVVDDVVIVHNGIIENFRSLKEDLIAGGAAFTTETDTEVVAQLIHRERANGKSPREAVRDTLQKLEGAFAIAILFKGEDNLMIGARNGPPLAIGHGEGEMFLGSDAIALSPFTNRITYLEDGDWVVLSRTSMEIFDAGNRHVIRPMSFSQASAMIVDKGNHRHFMAKEIAEQPEVVGHTLAEYIDFSERTIRLPEKLSFDFAKLERLTITGLSASHACQPKSMSPRSSATVKRHCRRMASPLSYPSQVRRPTHWPHCAIASRKASTRWRSSTCQNQLLPANAKWCSAPMPARKSVSHRPRLSPASSRHWLASPYSPARSAARSPASRNANWSAH